VWEKASPYAKGRRTKKKRGLGESSNLWTVLWDFGNLGGSCYCIQGSTGVNLGERFVDKPRLKERKKVFRRTQVRWRERGSCRSDTFWRKKGGKEGEFCPAVMGGCLPGRSTKVESQKGGKTDIACGLPRRGKTDVANKKKVCYDPKEEVGSGV